MNGKNGKTQDALVEMAKDLSMLDVAGLVQELDAEDVARSAGVPSVRPWSREKREAFHKMAIAFLGARGAVEVFRKAHLAEIQEERKSWTPEPSSVERVMGEQFQQELHRVDGLEREDIASRRAS